MKRRDFIKFSTAAAAAYTMGHSLNSFADSKDIGNVVVILCRGGMDGVAAIQPMQQSRLQDIRESCYIKTPLKLTADFDLHPKLSNFKSHWDNKNAAAVHATGFSYFGRSHFDGQNIMELGSYKPYTMSTGWLGRAMELKNLSSLALNLPTPIIVSSSAGNANYYPSKLSLHLAPEKVQVSSAEICTPFGCKEESIVDAAATKQLIADQPLRPSTRTSVMAIKALWANDPILSGFIDETTKSAMNYNSSRDPRTLAKEVARQMSLEGGPKVGFIEYSGFDTHSTQGADNGHQAKHLQKVDDIIRAFSSQSKSVWKKTVIVTVTEFGRTVRQNGSQGTDHGAASAILMAGGLIKQPKVIADWP